MSATPFLSSLPRNRTNEKQMKSVAIRIIGTNAPTENKEYFVLKKNSLVSFFLSPHREREKEKEGPRYICI